MTALFESGMPGLELQLASHLRGILTGCCLLPALLMGSTSFLDLMTALFESGMPGLELQLASHLRGILMQCGLLPALLMGSTFISGSADMTIRIWDARPGATIGQPHAHLFAQPNTEGWVKDSQGGLLYWVSTNHCKTLHSPALMTIPSTSPIRSVSLDFQDFVFGIHWSQIFNGTQ
jgi:WD40 repeat protein